MFKRNSSIVLWLYTLLPVSLEVCPIIKSIGSTNIDFPRYLAYVDELYNNFISSGSDNIPSTCYIARGYSNNREDYILKYLTSAITLEAPKSEQILKNMPTFELSFKGLFTDKSFKDIPEFELWIFGLIFWSLFCGKEINIARKEELKARFSQHEPNQYRKIGDIRDRIEISVSAYQEVLKDA